MSPDKDQLPIPASIGNVLDVGPVPTFGGAGPKKPKASSGVASFLGGASLPEKGTQGGKTLTGQ